MKTLYSSRLLGIATALVFAAGTLLGSSSRAAAEQESDLPLALDVNNLAEFVDSSGHPITVLSDSETGPERTVIGNEESGVPVLIKVYSSAPDVPTANDVVALATATE